MDQSSDDLLNDFVFFSHSGSGGARKEFVLNSQRMNAQNSLYVPKSFEQRIYGKCVVLTFAPEMFWKSDSAD